MSSWFDAKQLTSFAKSALNEAQKTLDKALDIQEEELEQQRKSFGASPKEHPLEEKQDQVQEVHDEEDDDRSSVSSVSSVNSSKALKMAVKASTKQLWGSFTGSFFDGSQVRRQDDASDCNVTSKEMEQKETGTSEEPPGYNDVVISAQPSSSTPFKEPTGPSSVTSSSSHSAFMEETNQEDIMETFDTKTISNDDGVSHLDEDGFSHSQLMVGHGSGTSQDISHQQLVNESEDLDCSMSSSGQTLITDASKASLESTSNMEAKVITTSVIADEDSRHSDEDNKRRNSDHLASMLNEAMVDQEKRSETSSSKSYEVVKAESSGQTSGDEFETTTTSSDIEVISSPTQTFRNCSPSGKAIKAHDMNKVVGHQRSGHHRTGSELSAAGSDECNIEVERLLKKISDLNEILDVRETKLVEMSKANLELQEKNTDLNSQVKEAMKINAKLSEASISSEDFTLRLSALEKKFQKTLAEKNVLVKENAKLLKENSNQKSQKELSDLIEEKDEIIQDLRHEGETLSKQVGKHSEIIKKLRSKEKSNEKEIKNLKKEVETLKSDNERLDKNLVAKDEVESKQIEAITNLTNANSKWEEEHNKVKSDLEDAQEKVSSLKTSLESSYKEIAELKRGLMEKEGEAQEMALSKEMAAKQDLQDQLRELQEDTRKQKDNLFAQIDELRSALSNEERASARREEHLRRERDDLMAKLEQSENRHEELSGSVSAATRPLLRQIESLQANLNEAQSASERVERSLAERLQQTSIQLAAAQERERTAAEQYMQVSSKAAMLESKLNNLTKEKTVLEVNLDAQTQKKRNLEEQVAKNASSSENMKKSFAEEVEELKRERDFLEASLDSEKSELGAEKRKNLSLVEQLKERDKRLKDIQAELDLTRSTRHPSPVPSIGQLSMNGSLSEGFSVNPWPRSMQRNMSTDEVFETSSMTSARGGGNLYDSMRNVAPSAALLENLQSQLKLKEGELTQMQIEMSHLERSKGQLTQEVMRLTQKAEKVENLEEELTHLKNAFVAMEQKYQTMLTMYGEKVEEAEELKLDLADVKEMYKTQIEELIRNSGK